MQAAKILIVEPDIRLAATYRAALEARGYQAVVTTTAQEAVLAADSRMPDLVLLELQLTAHGGVEFLYEFRSYAEWQHIPVLVLSNVPPAEVAASQKTLSGSLGVTAYYYKPRTSLSVLLHAVENTLSAAGKAAAVAGDYTLLARPA